MSLDKQYLMFEGSRYLIRCVKADIPPLQSKDRRKDVIKALFALLKEVCKPDELKAALLKIFKHERFDLEMDDDDGFSLEDLKKDSPETSEVCKEAGRLSEKALLAWYRNFIEIDESSIFDFIRTRDSRHLFSQRFRPIVAKLLNIVTPKLQRLKPKQKSGFETRLDEVTSCLKLTQTERKFLDFIYVSMLKSGRFKAIEHDEIMDSDNVRDYIHEFLDVSREEAEKLWKKDNTLIRLKLIDFEYGRRLSKRINMCDELREYLSGMYSSSFLESLFKKDMTAPLNINQFDVTDDEREILEGLLSKKGGKSVNILFYGAPGTGKSSLAATLAKEFNMQIFKIENPLDGGQENRIRKLLCACEYTKKIDNALILVDEADRILCSRYSWVNFGDKSDKGWFNEFFENSGCKILWITNGLLGIEDSTKRRFSFSKRFEPFSKIQRQKIWQDLVMKTPELSARLTQRDLEELSLRYDLNAGHIENAITQISSFLEKSKLSARVLLDRYLTSSVELATESELKQNSRLPCKEHSLEGLNVDVNLGELVKTIEEFSEYWATEKDSMAILNMNLLLFGPPGTGKTEFAKFLAVHLKRELIVKRGSDILSMWVGGSEKNIAAAFREAERNQAILFIDEADSLLWDREAAHRSWEVTQTNEFLCQMENFKGILICATNRTESFDSASLRRFNIKIHFDYLTKDGKAIFFERFFRRLLGDRQLSEEEQRMLAGLSLLAPGDFKVVWQKNAFRKKDSIDVQTLIRQLRAESEIKLAKAGRAVGFVSAD